MYKIFYENSALIFQNINENEVFFSDDQNSEDKEKLDKYVGIICNWLNNNDLKDTIIEEVNDARTLSSAIKSVFRLAPAAGGVVCQGKSFVSIMRNGTPDLPKGHIEKGESPSVAALREVEEETGIKCEISDPELPSTWHCYQLNDVWVMKQTFWYAMKPVEEIVFLPQREEHNRGFDGR